MTFDPRNMLSKSSSIFANPEWQRMAELAKQFARAAESIDDRPSIIGPHSSVKTNVLLSEQKELAEAQLAFLLEEAKASRSSAASTRRIAILANVIAAIAAIMAAIAAIPAIMELYEKLIAIAP